MENSRNNMKKRHKLGIFIGIIYIAAYLMWICFLGSGGEMNIMFWWEETFRRNWDTLTFGMNQNEIFMAYIRPQYSLRTFPNMLFFIFGAKLLFDTIMEKRDKGYSNCNSVKDFIKVYVTRQYGVKPILFHLSYLLFIEQVIKQLLGFGFPYIYGPLFLILPVVYIGYDFFTEYRIWRNLA